MDTRLTRELLRDLKPLHGCQQPEEAVHPPLCGTSAQPLELWWTQDKQRSCQFSKTMVGKLDVPLGGVCDTNRTVKIPHTRNPGFDKVRRTGKCRCHLC